MEKCVCNFEFNVNGCTIKALFVISQLFKFLRDEMRKK